MTAPVVSAGEKVSRQLQSRLLFIRFGVTAARAFL
jgi:hypothetical protein